MESNKNKLSFVAIVKNEEPYIIEWIEFHRLVGVNKFYIYDNESSDDLKKLLNPYIENGIVVYQYVPGKNMQNIVYADAIKKYKDESKYMGFIDIDEFVIPHEDNDLGDIVDDVLAKKEGAAGVAINWRIYGSNGYEKPPKGLVIENYKFRAEDDFDVNRHIKTICNPRKVVTFQNPHYPVYMKGYYSIDEDGHVIKGPFNSYGQCKKMQINHYFTKSKTEYVLKALRGKADSQSFRGMKDFIKHDQNAIYDNIMDQYIPIVQKNRDEIMSNFPKNCNYTELMDHESLPVLVERLEKKVQKGIYQRIRNKLASAYDSIAYEIEKKGRKR
ncbi:MAG: glycosyltransferase family 92 protein [Bacilli bacterium]|nr:glycosyltransferase family 92 protein [Bacilli bacterium]